MTRRVIWAVKLKDDEGDTVATYLTGSSEEYLQTRQDLIAIGARFETGSLVNVVPSQTLRVLAAPR